MAAQVALRVGGANRRREEDALLWSRESDALRRTKLHAVHDAEMDPVLNLEVRVLLHRTDVQQQHVCRQEKVLKQEESGLDQEEPEPLDIKEEQDEQNQTPTDQQGKPNECQRGVILDTRLIKQENVFRLDQEEPEPPPIKEEEMSPRHSHAENQLELNQETKAFILTSANEEQDQSESKPNQNQLRRIGSEADTSLISESRRDTELDRKPLQCSHCGKTFVCRAKLTAHTRVHTGEKPFVCKMCGKRFRTNDCLKRHVQIHTGVKVSHLNRVKVRNLGFVKSVGKDSVGAATYQFTPEPIPERNRTTVRHVGKVSPATLPCAVTPVSTQQREHMRVKNVGKGSDGREHWTNTGELTPERNRISVRRVENFSETTTHYRST